MSLLSVCQTMMAEIGLPAPVTIVGNPDPFAVQLLALANRAGKELAEDADASGYWQILRKQYVFQTSGIGPLTCTIIPGSNVLGSLSSTVGIQIGMSVYATGLVNDTLVVAPGVVGSTVAISQAPSASTLLTGQSVVFAQEAYPLPADLAYLIVQTEWDRNFRWQLLGPLDAQEWQVIKSGISPVGPRMRFRIMQGQLYINPVGSSAALFTNNLVFEYVSNAWVAQASAPTTGVQTTYQADTDTAILPEDLITLSLKYRFLKAKGLAWDDAYQEFKEKKEKATGRAASARNLPLNSRSTGLRLLSSQQIPDTNFGT
jgi:hypothetical protein